MNREMLGELLDLFDIHPRTYIIHWRGIPFEEDDRLALLREADGWHIFYTERGKRFDERIFKSESDACDELLMWIAGISELRRSVWEAHIPPQPDPTGQ